MWDWEVDFGSINCIGLAPLRENWSIFACMSKSNIVLVGSDATSRIALDVFAALDQIVLGILETDPKRNITELNDVSVFAQMESDDAKTVLSGETVEFFVAVGDNAERRRAYEYMAGIAKKPAAVAIHPTSAVSAYAKLGFGNLVNAGAVISANAVIGDQNIIHAHVSIETDARIGNYCHLSSGVRVGGNAILEDDVFVGTGAIIYPGITVGKGALIGAGSVVLREVHPGQVVHGNPASPVKIQK